MNSTLSGIGGYVDRRHLFVLSLIAALTLLVALLYQSSFVSMAAVWQSSDYRHGAVVFPVAAFLLWRSREPLAAVAARPFAWGLLALVPLVLLWVVARAVGVQVVEHLATVLLIPATVVTFLGAPLFRRAAFPLLFVVTAVPVGDTLIPYLMEVTADVSGALLRAVGVPVHREGQFLSLPGGDFEVADVCSGLAFLTAGTIVALLFAYLSYRSNAKRVAFVAAMAVTMIVANGVRAFTTMWVASASHMRYLAGRDHVVFGWILFTTVIMATLYVGARFADRVDDGSPRHPERVPGQPARAGYRSFGNVIALCAAAAVLIAGPLLFAVRSTAAAEVRGVTLSPPTIEGCGAAGAWSPQWTPELKSPDAVVAATYVCAGQPVDVFVGLYLDNLQGRELIGNGNRLLPADWRRFAVTGTHAFLVHGKAIDVNETRLTSPTEALLVWYWYAVEDKTATTPTMVKVLQALELIARGHADGSVYLLATPLDGSLDASRSRLASAARAIGGLAHPSRERSGR
jgi:exosortase A